MALTTLAHTRSVQVPAAATTSAYLDAIFNMLNAGTTWVPTKEVSGPDTVAVYAIPVAAEVSDLRVVFAGVTAGAPTPTMQNPDTFSINKIMAGISRGVTGAFIAWDNANPFADGDFSGYLNVHNIASWVADDLQIYTSSETIWYLARRNTQILGSAYGALFSTDDNSLINSQDGEGRIYGIIKTHESQDFAILTASATAPAFGANTPANGQNRCMAFQPADVFKQINRIGAAQGMSVAGQIVDIEGNPKLVPQYYYWSSLTPARFLGRIREVYAITFAQHGQVLQDQLAAPLAEIISEDTVLDRQAIGLLV